MKKSLLAAAALAAVSGAAQADVQLYGVLDEAVGSIQHSLSGSPTFPATVDPQNPQKTTVTGSVTGIFNGGISPSRWGIKGSEDMGNGRKAVFQLESGIDVNTGTLSNGAAALSADVQTPNQAAAATSINGQLFNRQAWVGLSDAKLGTIMAGRIYNPGFDIVVGYDPVQAAQLFSPLGFSGTFGGSLGATETLRNDNTVRYTNKIGAVNFGGMYKFGNVSGSTSAGSGWVLNAGYEEGKLGAQAAYGKFTDTINGGNINTTAANTTIPAGTIAASEFNTQGFMIGLKYKVTDQGTVKAGYQRFTRSTASDPYSVTVSGGVITASTAPSYYGYTIGSLSQIAQTRGFNTIWVGGDYNFTPNLNLSVGYYDIGYEHSGDNAQNNGDLRYYSALLDYSFSKRTDVYLGTMSQTASGVQFAATTYLQNNNITAVGIRHRF